MARGSFIDHDIQEIVEDFRQVAPQEAFRWTPRVGIATATNARSVWNLTNNCCWRIRLGSWKR